MRTSLVACVGIVLALATAVWGLERKRPAATQPSETAKGGELAALEKKLLRTWLGPACGGDFTFKADGTFDVRSFTPGQNVLAGTWSLRWDALPPTLLLTFKSSDFKRTYRNEPDYKYVGKTLEAKLLELSDRRIAFKVPGTEWDWWGEVGEEK